MVQGANSGSYIVTASLGPCNASSATSVAIVSVIRPLVSIALSPSLALGTEDSICIGNNIRLTAIPNHSSAPSYLWNTGEHNETIIPKSTGEYTLTATNQCSSADASLYLTLINCDSCLFVPNAFTPNGDGKNDFFRVRQLCPIRNYNVKIFNRYGQIVYSSYYVNEGWDGTLNGVPGDMGTYFYEIEYLADLPNAIKRFLKGDITLVR